MTRPPADPPPRLDPWRDCPVPPLRHEALYGDRIVRCFDGRPAGAEVGLFGAFEKARAAQPAREAVVCDGARWSYAEAGAAADRIAAGLVSAGIAAGERVVMLIGNRPEFLFVLLALQRLGAIAVPVGVREQRPGLTYIAGQCSAAAVIHDDDLAERLPAAGDCPALRLRLAVGELPTLPGSDDPPPPRAATAETEVAAILYTSGTTGRPKGAMLTHLAIAHSTLHYAACMRLGADERSALAVPASHVTGLVAIIATMWAVGGTVVVVPEFKADAFVALLAHERISHTLMVPAMYVLCLRSAAFAGADLSAWRIGGYGGAPMPVATIDALAAALPALRLLNAYGATETASPVTLMAPTLTRDHADSVGHALPAADIRVMDEAGREVAKGAVGELWIGGPMVVPGYWADPAATAAAFTAGHWHSGDLGSIDAAGFVRIVDRQKDMLDRGGYKIYSVEVENALMAWPGVVEAAVVGRPCPVLGQRVHAVLLAPGAAPDTPALQSHCRARLADYKVPETIDWSPTPLPRNANGKVLKRQLRDAG